MSSKSEQEINQLLSQPVPEDELQRLQYIKLFKELRDSL